ncbi:hypothetical protein WJX74_001581 [Apatococcus lobatus]|uniref:Protein kinase domain-containing protein n=1 Tax=Apatococcus lobatus TaxID=904363 RepID=A0AAW1QTD2_9CHLO
MSVVAAKLQFSNLELQLKDPQMMEVSVKAASPLQPLGKLHDLTGCDGSQDHPFLFSAGNAETGNVGDPSGATMASKRPDLMLFLSSILIFRAELKEDRLDFEKAVMELEEKMADWTPLVHEPRDYMLAAAAAGRRLRFCAVEKGGQQMKYISQEFDSQNQLHRLQIVHSSIGVLTIILQQHNHQMPSQPRPLGVTVVRETSSITYYGCHVIKEVSESIFTQMHCQGLNAVYTFLVKRHGSKTSQGLIRPMDQPQLKHNVWRVKLPLGLLCLLRALGSLQSFVRDILLGLRDLHAAGFVHRNIRLPNIIEVRRTSHDIQTAFGREYQC